MFLNFKEEVKKLVSVLATSTLMTRTREEAIEAIEIAETVGVSKDGKENEDKYLENLVQVLCI